jgi:hypothetical protein
MKRAGWAILVALAAAPVAAGAAAPDPRALLEASIARHGGRAALEAMANFKAVGTLEPGGRWAGRTLDAVVYERADGGRRTEVTFEFRGRKGTFIEIYDGVMCKQRFSTSWDDLPLDENRERVENRVSVLLSAADRSPTLAGEGTEAGVEVWRVALAGEKGTTTLSVAKDDDRLIAVEYPGTEAEGMGTKKEVVRKVVHHAFRAVGGVVLPTDIEIFKDGSLDGRWRYETVEEIREWDDEWLRVPDPRRRFIPPEELAS